MTAASWSIGSAWNQTCATNRRADRIAESTCPHAVSDVIAHAPFVGTMDVDARGTITHADSAAIRMLRLGEDEPIGRTLEPAAGRSISDIVDQRLVLAIRQSLVPGQCRILRAILHGWQMVLTARGHDEDGGFSFVIQQRSGIIPQLVQGFEVCFLRCASLGRLDALSNREIEVAAWIGMGRTVRRIGEHLHRSVKTIENHRVAIGKKLGVSDRLDIAILAHQAGLRPEDVNLERL